MAGGDEGLSGRPPRPYHSLVRLLVPILLLASIYFVFIYHDGALFVQLTDRLGAWLGDRLTDGLSS